MHADPAPPIRPRASRQARAWVWLLALGIALQGSVIATARAAEPAHVHAPAAADRDRDPMLDGVRVVRDHHGAARHQHADVERHAHDLADADVHYVDDGSTGADAAKNGSAKRIAADLDTPTASFSLPPAALPPGEGCTAPRCDYTSHIGARLERPPR